MKFTKLPLKVPNLEKVKIQFENLIEEFNNAASSKEAYDVIKKYFKLSDQLATEFTIISIRFSIDTLDKKNIRANEIANEISPQINNFSTKFDKAVLESKFRKELEEKLGKHYFDILENNQKVFNEVIIEDLIEENKLVNKYEALLASAQIEFEGEKRNLSQLGKFMTSKNRDTRINAAKAYYGFLKENDDKIGDIYDKLVKLRTKMAQKLGYKNYVEFGYRRLGRLDYNAEMVANYRNQIKEVVVPEVEKLVQRQIKRIKIKNPLFIDLNLEFLSGNATPKGKIDELVRNASKMYHEMSDETGKFFDFMVDSELMDLEAKKGKMGGGYMTYLPKYKAPFIFSNSNGSSQDVDTLTHEVGHAFQGYLSSKINNPALRSPTLEACEIHSMSMEFFARPWMELFFKEDKDKYLYSHLSNAISFLPYGVAVDEFQHFVYENPEATHKERCLKWKEIDHKYRPWLNYDGFDYLENGGYWVRQTHIFSTPFYYIDYTLAQVLALQFKCEMDKNREKAWKKYLKLLKLGGKYPFIELLEKAKLRNPFEDGNVKKVIKPQIKVLKTFNDQEM